MDTTYTGTLQISVVSALGMTPIPGATVTVSYTGDPDSPLETMTTDESGQTPTITLDAPPRELSLSPDITAQPYSEYNIQVTAEGFEPVLVSGSEILAGEFSLHLKRPIYRQSAVFGHFGRKEFPWEKTDKAEQLRDTVM